ncbi:MAG: ABC transporter transmembrane domain-containing protein [Acetobacteraceae bacterium]
MRDVGIASLALSALTMLPPLLVMQVIDRVVTHRSASTLTLLCTILVICVVFDTLLGFARRELIQVVSTRVDTRLNLHVYSKMLSLPLDYFEKHPAGQTAYRMMQVNRVREFVTGKLMGTLLDTITLVFLLPFLFWMNATLAWLVLVGAGLIAVIIMLFLPSIGRLIGRVVAAETAKSGVLVETVQGIRTVKSLALEPQRKIEWDGRVAEAARPGWRPAAWPTGRRRWPPRSSASSTAAVIMVGAFMILAGNTEIGVGSLVAFMLLGGRVTAPLVGLAKLIEDFQDVRAAIAEVGAVLNSATEQQGEGGLRPQFEGCRHLRQPDLHLSGREDAGAGWRQLQHPGRHDDGRGSDEAAPASPR